MARLGRTKEARGASNHLSQETFMANITRFEPFSDLDDLVEGFFVRPMRFDLDAPKDLSLKVDVTRTDDTYTVKAEMPGVKKEDINVAIEGSQVTISGEVKDRKSTRL